MTAAAARPPRIAPKPERHRAILDLVRARAIRTQEELVDALRGLHLDVTQATVSRDVRELGLLRVADGDGLRYVAEIADVDPGGTFARLRAALREHVRSIEMVDALGVIRSRPSTAPLVAAAVDAAHFEEVAGTVAGDDTVLVVSRGRGAARRLRSRLLAMMGRRQPAPAGAGAVVPAPDRARRTVASSGDGGAAGAVGGMAAPAAPAGGAITESVP